MIPPRTEVIELVNELLNFAAETKRTKEHDLCHIVFEESTHFRTHDTFGHTLIPQGHRSSILGARILNFRCRYKGRRRTYTVSE